MMWDFLRVSKANIFQYEKEDSILRNIFRKLLIFMK